MTNFNSLSFTAILDDRGRIVIPARIRNIFNLKFNSLILLEFKKKINDCSSVMNKRKIYGDDSTMVSISDCGSEDLGSNPSRRPILKRGNKDEK